MLYFVTGNAHKFEEAKKVLPELVQVTIDLPEIQSADPKEIVKAKLQEAFKHKQGEFLVEDTSLSFDCLNGLPGPFIKFFLENLGRGGLYELAMKYNNFSATARTIVGYAKSPDSIEYFVGEMSGKIVEPVAQSDFGWDPIFQPDGYEVTYAEMSEEEKTSMSHRTKAFLKLKEYLCK